MSKKCFLCWKDIDYNKNNWESECYFLGDTFGEQVDVCHKKCYLKHTE
jgi:hypothetical protein